MGEQCKKAINVDFDAFLNSELNEDVYIEPPAGYKFAPKGMVLKLHKALDGLKQLPKELNMALEPVSTGEARDDRNEKGTVYLCSLSEVPVNKWSARRAAQTAGEGGMEKLQAESERKNIVIKFLNAPPRLVSENVDTSTFHYIVNFNK